MMTSPSSGIIISAAYNINLIISIISIRWTATEDGDVKLKLFWEIAQGRSYGRTIQQNDSASVVLLIIVILIMN